MNFNSAQRHVRNCPKRINLYVWSHADISVFFGFLAFLWQFLIYSLKSPDSRKSSVKFSCIQKVFRELLEGDYWFNQPIMISQVYIYIFYILSRLWCWYYWSRFPFHSLLNLNVVLNLPKNSISHENEKVSSFLHNYVPMDWRWRRSNKYIFNWSSNMSGLNGKFYSHVSFWS